MRLFRQLFLIANLFLLFRGEVTAQDDPAGVLPRDCVQIRYILGVWMNPQGTRVAYLVKSPDLIRNRNDYQLYVKDLQKPEVSSGKLLLSGPEISAITWFGDGSHLVLLESLRGIRSLLALNVGSGSRSTLLTLSRNIEAYSIDSSGRTVAFSIADAEAGKHSTTAHSGHELAIGYRIPYGEDIGGANSFPTSSLYVIHRNVDGTWTSPKPVSLKDPFTHERLTHIRELQDLSLSPNGKRLALNYATSGLPEEWKSNPWVKYVAERQALPRILVIQDLERHETSLGFKTVFPDSVPVWARDSNSFLVNAHSPVGTSWEQDDIRDHLTSALDANLFWVDVISGQIQEVLRHVPDHHEGILFWREDGDIIVDAPGAAVTRLHQIRNSWRETGRIVLPKNDNDQFWFLASNGEEVVGVHQTVIEAENLFLYEPRQKSMRMLTDLNPQLRHVRFSPVKRVTWTTDEGLVITGLLFMPPNYDPARRYPMVIQTKGDQGQFTCDSGANHDPSFAPQPLASAGILYLARIPTEGFNLQDELARAPTGYPGQLGLAEQQVDIWDSAVRSLSSQGIVDPDKVGIIGFSATGFYVEYALIHSPVRYAAATATDNAQYSLSEYWLTPTFADTEESMYGGPPYGKTLKNWQQYSISFNLDKVHTPLLMEEMGYAVHDDILGSMPQNLAVRYELVKGLTRLGKPVELYYYPDEGHAPDNPSARLATLQRNVDWYRFWLQGYEDPDPVKKEQNLRWRRLRDLHIADLRPKDEQSISKSAATY
jgi:dipeptidyl aminopeptidase/acylaminoacyl peptidase